MKRFRSKNAFSRMLRLMTTVLIMLSINTGFAVAQKNTSIVIEHNPPDYFVPEHRMIVQAKVRSDAEISQVRCYFRADKDENYVFVSMGWVDDALYKGILPAMSKESQALEYLFVAVNEHGQAEKTGSFEISKNEEKKVPAWQQVASGGDIQVGTDLSQIPEMNGLSDSIIVDIVAPSAGFDTVGGGNYPAISESDTENAGLMPVGSDTASASDGLSTTAVAGIAGGVAVVGGLIAAVVSGGSDDEMNISPSNAQLSYTGGQNLSVLGGEAPYSWTSTNPSVGDVYPGASSDSAVFSAFRSGSTSVMVSDRHGESASVTIDVADPVDVISIRD